MSATPELSDPRTVSSVFLRTPIAVTGTDRPLHTAALERIAAAPLATPAPDCPAARALRDRICDLAAAICVLAARNPANGELQAQCSGAETTCSQARDDVAQSCDR